MFAQARGQIPLNLPSLRSPLAMKLSGVEHIALPIPKVWKHLTDLEWMATTVPGLERVEKAEPKHLECRVKPALSFVTGSMQVVFDILEEQPETFLRIRVLNKAI